MKTIAFLLLVSFAHNLLGNEASRILEVQIHSPSLEGNLLGDSADRLVQDGGSFGPESDLPDRNVASTSVRISAALE